jgi:hypothetical protein
MAERLVSPGVFTNEKDLSFLPAGIANIGAAIIGPTSKGPAFVPTIVNSFDDFTARFGGLSEETYVPYTVKTYLRNAASVTIVRVLQIKGYRPGAFQIIHSSSLGYKVVGALVPSAKVGSSDQKDLSATVVTGLVGGSISATGSLGLTISGSGVGSQAVSASTLYNSNISFDKVFTTSVKSPKNAYLYVYFKDFLTSTQGVSGSIEVYSASWSSDNTLVLSGSNGGTSNYWGAYGPAATPYITSQTISGQDPVQLFRFVTLGDGTDTNTAYKISIINNTLPGDDPASDYGLFTVVIRDYNDTDQRPVVLESYSNCSLDPDSANYIGRKIGTKYYTVDASTGELSQRGDYENVSKYVYVEIDSAVADKGISPTLKPFGFQGLYQPIAGLYSVPTASYVASSPTINNLYNRKAYYGWNFASTDNANYLKPIPSGSTVVANTNFNLDNCTVHPSASKVDSNSSFTGGANIGTSTFKGLDVQYILKFNVPLQGGFDGMDPAITKKVGSNIVGSNLFGFDCSTQGRPGADAYIKALNVLGNGDQYDINILVAPGATIADHAVIVNKAVEIAEDRGDTFVIADPVVQGSTLGSAVSAVANSGIDSNYVATYWPWVKILDTDRNKPVWVPPSVVIPGVLAFNDNVAFEWFAPAGLNRGGIPAAIDIETKLSFTQRDNLYENRINPIATFPAQGICVWGQKTLQTKPSALDRINVRRLLIALKKFIASSTRYLVFENNTTQTRQRFINIVEPYLTTVQQRQGLYAFRIVMDETNNTADIIDRNILYGQIYIQPAKTAEFIVIDFNILPTGATFDNV